MSNPTVSVIIPAYNAETFIGQAIESVLVQTFRDFEVIVVNDGSCDKTSCIVKEFIDKDKRICLVEQVNTGAASARNTGIKKSRGEFVAFLDADDLWHKEKIECQVSYMYKYPKVGLVSCLTTIIDENNNLIGLKAGRDLNGMVYKKILDTGGIQGGSVALVRLDCFSSVGLFDETLLSSADWDMWLRITEKYPIVTVPRVLVGYRRNSTNMSGNSERLKHFGELVLNKAFSANSGFSKQYYNFCFARWLSAISAWCFVDRKYDKALKYIKSSLRISPIATFTEIQRFGLLVLIFLTRLLPSRFFEEVVRKRMLPVVFGLKYGHKFG